MTKENDVHRTVQDIGTAVVNAVITRLNAAVGSGELMVSRDELPKLLELVNTSGKTAMQGALNVYYRTFDSYKK